MKTPIYFVCQFADGTIDYVPVFTQEQFKTKLNFNVRVLEMCKSVDSAVKATERQRSFYAKMLVSV